MVVSNNLFNLLYVLCFYQLYNIFYFKDTIKEMTRLSEFLGLNSDPKLMREISDACDFHTMKREKDSMENLEHWKDGVPGIYRKG